MSNKKIIKALAFGSILMISPFIYADMHNSNTQNSNNKEAATNGEDKGVLERSKQFIEDASITTTIMGKYTTSPVLSVFAIGVETNDGVVTLRGTVDTDVQKNKAIEIAGSTSGVKEVKSDLLKVKKSNDVAGDTMLEGKIKAALVKEKLFNGKDYDVLPINIDAYNGDVYVTGEIENKNQADEIISVIKSVEGVESVKTDFTIKAKSE